MLISTDFSLKLIFKFFVYFIESTFAQEVNNQLIISQNNTVEKYDYKTVGSIRMKDLLGINAFEWNFVDPSKTGVIDEEKMDLIKSFGGVRHYLDWNRIESKEGQYTFNPTHSGSWNYDLIYKRSKQEGIFILADIKTLPDWLLATYPENQRDYENIPMAFNMPREKPSSYIQQAKLGFQFAARYGSNKDIDKNLVKVFQQPRWTADPENEVKIGLSLIEYIECDNERDKWWKGKQAEQTPEEYAANLSAFYDGHKGTLGKDVGVKTADPNMKVVMGGLARPDVEYLKRMVNWCRANRGMKNGKVDLCFDVINYHQYANGEEVAGINDKRGLAPEVSLLALKANDFVSFAKTLYPEMEVWVTEVGYDINQASTQRAIPIKNKSELITQADWNLRTALLYARKGVAKVFFYMLRDVSKVSTTQYSSSGFIEGTKRRPVANYFLQVKNLMGEYEYQTTLNEDPLVDVYSLNKEKIFVLTQPSEKGKESEYKLNLKGFNQAIIYTLDPYSITIKSQIVKIKNESLIINVTETPVFVKGVN